MDLTAKQEFPSESTFLPISEQDVKEEEEEKHFSTEYKECDFDFKDIKIEYSPAESSIDLSDEFENEEASSSFSNDDPLSLKTNGETKSETAVVICNDLKPLKAWTRLPVCTKNCHIRITGVDQKHNFHSYWLEGTYESRFRLMEKMIRIRHTDKKTYLPEFVLYTAKGLAEVCRDCLRLTLDESDDFISTVLAQWMHKVNGFQEEEPKTRKRRHISEIVEQPCKIRAHDRVENIETEDLVLENIKTETLTIQSSPDDTFVDAPETLRSRQDSDTISNKLEICWTPLPVCVDNCHTLISENNQKRIFDFYWIGKTIESRLNFLRQMTKMEPRKQHNQQVIYVAKYSLDTDEGRQEVCGNCFHHILNENNRFVTSILEEKMQEIRSNSSVKKYEGLEIDKPKEVRQTLPPSSKKGHSIVTKDITEDNQKRIFKSYSRNIISKIKLKNKILGISSCENSGARKAVNPNTNLLNCASPNIWRPLPLCDKKCSLLIKEDDQKRIFQSYWQDSTDTSRINFVNEMTEVIGRPLWKYNYDIKFYLNTEEGRQEVCRVCFRLTIGEQDNFITSVLEPKFYRFRKSEKCEISNVESKISIRRTKLNLIQKTDKIPSNIDLSSLENVPSWVPLRRCLMKCYSTLSEDDQKIQFYSYHQQTTFQSKYEFIKERIEISNLNSSPFYITHEKSQYIGNYYFHTKEDRRKVCSTCFQRLFAKSEYLITAVFEKEYYEQGRIVEEHIKKFPLCESHHFNIQDTKKYLPIGLTVRIMYDLYRDEVSNPLQFNQYQNIFELIGPKLKPEFLGQCVKCELIIIEKLKLVKEFHKRSKMMTHRINHVVDANAANECKARDKKITFFNTSLMVCFFDFQQSLPTPFLTNAKAFYKRPLWIHNFKIQNISRLNHVMPNPKFYMWHEAQGKRAANEVASCLYQYLQNLPSEIKHIIFYSTSCCGISRSTTISKMFLYLLKNHKTLEMVEHKFLVDGHSEGPTDLGNFSIENLMSDERGEILQPQDWYKLFKKRFDNNGNPEVVPMNPQMFYDFERLREIRLGDNESFLHENIKWLQYTKQGLFCFKQNWKTREWCDVLNMNPESSIKNSEQLWNLESIPLTEEKKKDLLDILKLMSSVSPEVKQFYEELPVEEIPQQTDFDSNVSSDQKSKRLEEKSSILRMILTEIDMQGSSNSYNRACIIKEEVDLGKCDLNVQEVEDYGTEEKEIEALSDITVKDEKIEES